MSTLQSRFKLVIILLFIPILSFAQYHITGTCVDEQQQPLPSVIVKLTKGNNREVIKHTASNSDGKFLLQSIDRGEYHLQLSYIGFKEVDTLIVVQNSIDMGAISLAMDSKLLNEVVISAQVLNSFGNRDEILLTSEALSVGNNALDAISSLPQFKKNFMDDQLITVDNKSILILINGKRATYRELQQISSKDVQKLVYYSEPPARFAHENIGAVLEVQTRRSKSKSHYFYLDAKNSFTTGYGTNMLNYTYSDENNQFTVGGFCDYRALNDNRMNNVYKYGDGTSNTYEGLPGSYKGYYNIGQMRYRRYFSNNAFVISQLEYRQSPGHEKYEQSVTKIFNNRELIGKSGRDLKSNYNSLAFDLYYHQPLGENKLIGINFVNTISNSKSNNSLNRVMEGANKDYDYTYENLTHNKVYSLIGEVLYQNDAWNFGGLFSHEQLRQSVGGDKSSPQNISSNKLYVYSDYSGRHDMLSYNLGVGLEYSAFKNGEDKTFRFVIPRPAVTLNYKLGKSSSLRLNTNIQPTLPSLGYLADSPISIDEGYYFRGNSNLKPYYTSRNSLDFRWNSSDNNFFISSSLNYDYAHKPFMPIISSDGDRVLRNYEAVKNSMIYGASVSGSARLFDFLTLQPYYQLAVKKYETPNQKINHQVHSGGIGALIAYRAFQLSYYFNFPFTDVNGDFLVDIGSSHFASLMWKHKTLSLSLEWINNPNPTRSYTALPQFSMEESTVWNNFRSLFYVKLTYYFQKGKSKRHENAVISNQSRETGLVIENTAK